MRRTALLLAAAALAGCTPPPQAAPTPGPRAPEGPARVDHNPDAFPTLPPATGPAAPVSPPSPVVRKLPNGLTVMYVRQPELPVVHATLVVRGAGSTDDPADLPGLASFTAGMLDEGAGGRSPLELADALDLLGASLNVGAGWDAATANLYVLRKNFPAALALLSDVVLRPDFPANELERVKNERLTALGRAKDEPTVIAGNAFAALVYGQQHPYGRFATSEATRRLDRAAVAAFHAGRYRPENATLVLVGDVDAQALHAEVERAFGGWRARGAAAELMAWTAPTLGVTTIYLIDKPGAAQSQIRIGHPGVPRSTDDYFALRVLNTILGGSFTSRLNTNLREVHGFTYGAGSSFAMRLSAGPFTAQSAVRTNATDSALVEFFNELRRIRSEPVSAEELEKAKRFVALGFPRTVETTSGVAGQLADLVTYGIDPAWLGSFTQGIMAVTAEDVSRVAREYVRPDQAVVVVVGDRSQVEDRIRALGLGTVEIREVAEFTR